MEKMISELATIEANSIDIINDAKNEVIQMTKDFQKQTEEFDRANEARKEQAIMKVQKELQEDTDKKLSELLEAQERQLIALKSYYEDQMPLRVEELMNEMLG